MSGAGYVLLAGAVIVAALLVAGKLLRGELPEDEEDA